MAKSSALTRFAPRPIIVNVPRRSIRRGVSRAVHHVRRGGRAVGRAARKVPSIPVALGGLVVGYADGRGMLNQLPAIGGSRMNTLAIVGWGLTRFIRHPAAKAAGLAMLGAATYSIGFAQAKGAAGGAQGDGGAGAAGGY